jgi:CIC family chloride channel protein
VACGAAGGYASGFNAPLAGILFAIELILPTVTRKALWSVVISVIIATSITRLCLGDYNFFRMVDLQPALSSHPYLAYIILGVLAGLVATIFIYALHKSEAWFNSLKFNPYVIHATAMVILGIITWGIVSVTGHYESSYAAIVDIMHGSDLGLGVLLSLLVLKIVLTCLTLASGGSGGVFSPSLFMGSVLGGMLYSLLSPYMPSIEGHMLGFVIAGMAGLAGGISAAVLTSAVIMLEITGQYYLALPVLLVSITANLTRSCLINHSIYEGKTLGTD